MRFKEETWLPMIGDKFISVVTDGKAIVLDKSNSKKFVKSLADSGLSISGEVKQRLFSGQPPVLTTGYLGIQSSSKHMIEQYRKSRDK
jgi:hypothetical protein